MKAVKKFSILTVRYLAWDPWRYWRVGSHHQCLCDCHHIRLHPPLCLCLQIWSVCGQGKSPWGWVSFQNNVQQWMYPAEHLLLWSDSFFVCPQVFARLREQQPLCVWYGRDEEQQPVQILQVQRLQSTTLEPSAVRIHPAILARLGCQTGLHYCLWGL